MDFLNSSIFYYLILLAIPIIIHLFNFRRHKKIYFSTIFFLKKIEEKNKSKYQIKRWIILLTRLCAIARIILAFGLPYIKKVDNSTYSNKTGFYIDNSFSMNRSDNNQVQLIEYAKKNVTQIISKLSDDHKILIMTNDFEKKHQKWYSPTKAIELVNEIEISNNSEKLETIINRFNNIIDTLKTNDLYLFSDFQNKSHKDNTLYNKYLNLKIGLLNVENNTNISIDSCYFSTPIRQKNQMETLYVVISNHGDEDRTVKVKLSINRQQMSIYNLEIPANSSVSKDFQYVNPMNINLIKGIIELEDNNISFDNKLFFSYSTNEKVKVSVIHDKNISTALLNVLSDSLFDFQSYNVNQIDYRNLYDSELIIIDQLREIHNSLSNRLIDYLNHGGKIFMFLNKKIDINSYNIFLKNADIDIIDQWHTGDYKVEYINYQNEIFTNVFNKKNNRINLPLVNGYFSMKKNNKSQMRKILNLLNNEAFLSEYICKKGRFFICTSDLSTDNNNFSNHALFIPCIYNAAFMPLKNNQLYHTIQNETIIEGLNINKNDIIRLEKKGSFDMNPLIISNNQRTLINFKNIIPHADNYNLITNQTNISPISFNYDRFESSMNFLNKNKIINLFSDKNIDFLKIENNSLKRKSNINQENYQLQYIFIISAIILLIIELILLRIWKM